jgi:RNA polymerase sigma factor (sigma-70 family)
VGSIPSPGTIWRESAGRNGPEIGLGAKYRPHRATFFRPAASKQVMARLGDIVLDELTVQRARRGDRAALEAVYHAVAAPLFTLICRLVRRRAVAEELLQETFVDVLRHIGTWEGRAPLPMWIRQVAVSRCLMYLRSPWHRSLDWLDAVAGEGGGPDSLPSPVPDMARAANAALDVERALEALSVTGRAVVWLHDVEGYTHEEIAAALGRSTSFSKSQLSRAHARLRALLEPAKADACTSIPTNC